MFDGSLLPFKLNIFGEMNISQQKTCIESISLTVYIDYVQLIRRKRVYAKHRLTLFENDAESVAFLTRSATVLRLVAVAKTKPAPLWQHLVAGTGITGWSVAHVAPPAVRHCGHLGCMPDDAVMRARRDVNPPSSHGELCYYNGIVVHLRGSAVCSD